MRDWNYWDNFSNERETFRIFSLPMRDWNKNAIELRKLNVFPHFQPTYEGLKQFARFKIYDFPFLIFSLPMRDWNIYSEKQAMNYFYIFSLPMRDWNF